MRNQLLRQLIVCGIAVVLVIAAFVVYISLMPFLRDCRKLVPGMNVIVVHEIMAPYEHQAGYSLEQYKNWTQSGQDALFYEKDASPHPYACTVFVRDGVVEDVGSSFD